MADNNDLQNTDPYYRPLATIDPSTTTEPSYEQNHRRIPAPSNTAFSPIGDQHHGAREAALYDYELILPPLTTLHHNSQTPAGSYASSGVGSNLPTLHPSLQATQLATPHLHTRINCDLPKTTASSHSQARYDSAASANYREPPPPAVEESEYLQATPIVDRELTHPVAYDSENDEMDHSKYYDAPASSEDRTGNLPGLERDIARSSTIISDSARFQPPYDAAASPTHQDLAAPAVEGSKYPQAPLHVNRKLTHPLGQASANDGTDHSKNHDAPASSGDRTGNYPGPETAISESKVIVDALFTQGPGEKYVCTLQSQPGKECGERFSIPWQMENHLDNFHCPAVKRPYFCVFPGCRNRYWRQNRLSCHVRRGHPQPAAKK